MDYIAQMQNLKKEHEFFIGFDSDGCIFDTMEIKQKECFCPNFVNFFGMQAASKYAREVWEFVNLYSKTRGCNRFPAVQRALQLLRERQEIKARGISVAVIQLRYVELKGDGAFEHYVRPHFTKLGPALEKCASPGMFYSADSPEQIQKAFAELAVRIRGALRLMN